jgi:hypothetical protein
VAHEGLTLPGHHHSVRIGSIVQRREETLWLVECGKVQYEVSSVNLQDTVPTVLIANRPHRQGRVCCSSFAGTRHGKMA